MPSKGGELVADVRLQHLRTIGADRVSDLPFAQSHKDLAELLPIGDNLRHQVRGWADLQHNLPLCEDLHRLRIPRRLHAVANAVWLQLLDHFEHLAHRPRLSRVHGDAEARLACSAEHALVFGHFEVGTLAPCNIDPDDPSTRPGDRLLDDDLVLSQGEFAVKDEDDPRLHRILKRRTISPSDGGGNDVV